MDDHWIVGVDAEYANLEQIAHRERDQHAS